MKKRNEYVCTSPATSYALSIVSFQRSASGLQSYGGTNTLRSGQGHPVLVGTEGAQERVVRGGSDDVR